MPATEHPPIEVAVVGAGMIVHDQILPSLYHLQRLGIVGQIQIAATSSARIRELTGPRFGEAFPGQSFTGHPPADAVPEVLDPFRYQEVVARLPPRNLVVIATPDPLHREMISFLSSVIPSQGTGFSSTSRHTSLTSLCMFTGSVSLP